MSYDNPFASPSSSSDGLPGPSEGPVTPLVLAYLRETRPWVLFLSVLGFILSGLMICGGASMALVSMAGSAVGEFSGAMGVVLGLVYLAMAAIYVFPSLFLWRYGSSISGLLATEDAEQLETALKHQRSFWRFVGIATAIGLGLYLLFIVVMFIAAFVGMAAI